MHRIEEASLQKIGFDMCNYFGILMAIKSSKCRLQKHPYLTFSSLLSACCYILIEISGAKDGNWCGVVWLTYRGTSLVMAVDLLLEKVSNRETDARFWQLV